MYEGRPYRLFLRYAVPQMVGLLFNSVYTIVDGIFIGNRLGREAMAAAAVAVPLVELLISLALAVTAGAGVLIATHLELREWDKARRVFNTAICLLGAAGILIAVLGNLFLCPLASPLGATSDILGQSGPVDKLPMKRPKYDIIRNKGGRRDAVEISYDNDRGSGARKPLSAEAGEDAGLVLRV